MSIARIIKKELKEMGLKSSVKTVSGCFTKSILVSVLSAVENKIELVKSLAKYESGDIDGVIVEFS